MKSNIPISKEIYSFNGNTLAIVSVASPGSCIESGYGHLSHAECKFVMDKRPNKKRWKEKNANKYYPSNCMDDQGTLMGWGNSKAGKHKLGSDQKGREKFKWINVCKITKSQGIILIT